MTGKNMGKERQELKILPNPTQKREITKKQQKQPENLGSNDNNSNAYSSEINKAKERRSKACTNCRKSKVKCIKLDNDQVCKRCRAQGIQCAYEFKVPSYKVVGNSSNSLEPMQRSRTKIPNLLETENKSTDRSSLLHKISISNVSQIQSQQIDFMKPQTAISRLLNPIDLSDRAKLAEESQHQGDHWKSSVEDRLQQFGSKLGNILTLLERQSQPQQQQQVSDQKMSQLPGFNTLTSSTEFHQPRPQISYSNSDQEQLTSNSNNYNKRTFLNCSPPLSQINKRQKTGTGSVDITQAESRNSSISSNSGFSTDLSITSHLLSLENILDKEGARELFEFFDSNISPQLFGFSISHYSVDDIWTNCPLLIATICCIASIHHPSFGHLSSQLESLIYQISKDILFNIPYNEMEAFNTIIALCFCGFWFRKNQMFTGLALQLAKTMHLISPRNKKSLIPKKDRLKLWYLLYILDGQQSLVFNRNSMFNSEDEVLIKSKELLGASDDSGDGDESTKRGYENGQEVKFTTSYSNLRLVSQVEYHNAIGSVLEGDAWSLLTPASFGLPFKTNLELDKWMVQWTVLLSPFNNNPIWSSKSTLIYYNFAKMHINSSAVRNFHADGAELPSFDEIQNEEDETEIRKHLLENGNKDNSEGEEDDYDSDDDNDYDFSKEMSSYQSRRVSSELALSAAETVLNIVLNDSDILGALKFVPIHIHIMLYYAALLILRPPTYLQTTTEKSIEDSINSIKLVKKLRHAILMNSPTDKSFSIKVIEGLSRILEEKVNNMKKKIANSEDRDKIFKELEKSISNDDCDTVYSKKKVQKISAWPGYDPGHPSKKHE